MIQASLARRYARALLQIGIEDGTVEKLEKELESFDETVHGSPELSAFLADPTVPSDARAGVLAEIVSKLKLSEVASNFIRLLGEKGRIHAFADIHREYRQMADEHAGRARGTVVSAAPLSKEAEKSLTERLSKLIGRKVELTRDVDKDLLGGLVAEINGVVYDNSVRTQLRAIRDMARK